MQEKNKKLRILIQWITIAVLLAITVPITLYILHIKDDLDSFEALVQSFGVWGVVFMFLLQVVQVVLAVIPGEPVELVMGALYGTVWGTLLCIAGIVVGTALIYILVKRLGRNFVEKIMDWEKFRKLKFLKNPAKRDTLMFFLMFLPGTPKDLLTYFAPFTGISLPRILIIAAIARIPSVITSTYVGSSFAQGNHIQSLILYAVVGAVSLAGILIYNRSIRKRELQETEGGEEKDADGNNGLPPH